MMVQVKLAAKPGMPFYTFQDIVKDVGLDNQWLISGFTSRTDSPELDNSVATLYREKDEPVTLGQFCEQSGIDRELMLEFAIL